MVQLNLSSKYFLYNRALGGDIVLGSTPSNDSLLILPMSYENRKLWQFSWITEASVKGYLYFTTVEKGTKSVLGVYSDNGDSSNPIVDFHFGERHGATGQFWTLKDQKDGTVTLGNKYVGNNYWVDVVKDSSPPRLAFSYSTGMRWTLSEATATLSRSSTFTTSASSTASSTPSLSPTPSSSSAPTQSTLRTSSVIGSILGANTSVGTGPHAVPGAQKHGVRTGTIAGIVVGVLAAVTILAIAACLLVRRRRRYEESPPPPVANMTANRPVLNGAH